MAKVYSDFLFRIIPQEKDLDSFDPQSQNLSGEDSICMVDRLGIPRIKEFFSYFFFVFIIIT